MRTSLALIAALGLAVAAGPAGAKPCKDASGKFVKCPAATATAATPAATSTAAATPAAGGYTLDAKARCRDASGKMAKKAMCAGASTTTATTMSAATRAGAGPAAGSGAATMPMSSHSTRMATARASGTAGAPHCKKGKLCGNACIAQNEVCHKP